MKIGAENKKKVAIMAVLLVIAVPLLIHTYSTLSGSSTSAAASSQAAPDPATPKKSGNLKVREETLDPTLRTDILMASQRIQYDGGTRNIFTDAPPPPQKIPQVEGTVRPPQAPPLVPPPPTHAPIPLKFYGFSSQPGEPRKAFLQNGTDIFVAVEGAVVDHRYRILKITNTFVLVEDVLGNYQQTINLTPPQTG